MRIGWRSTWTGNTRQHRPTEAPYEKKSPGVRPGLRLFPENQRKSGLPFPSGGPSVPHLDFVRGLPAPSGGPPVPHLDFTRGLPFGGPSVPHLDFRSKMSPWKGSPCPYICNSAWRAKPGKMTSEPYPAAPEAGTAKRIKHNENISNPATRRMALPLLQRMIKRNPDHPVLKKKKLSTSTPTTIIVQFAGSEVKTNQLGCASEIVSGSIRARQMLQGRLTFEE